MNGLSINEITIGRSHPAKAPSPILVTLFGMVTEVRPEQLAKACLPMLVTLLGMVIEVNPEQPENTPASKLITLFGIVTEVSLEHSWNILSIDIQLLMSYMVKNGLMG